MINKEDKKKWIPPKLIVLLRASPEEAVLYNCKDYSSTTESANASLYSCTYKNDEQIWCCENHGYGECTPPYIPNCCTCDYRAIS